MKRLLFGLFLLATPAGGDDLKPMDRNAVDPELVNGFFGVWQIQNEDASKTCDVKLLKDDAIGGMTIELTDGCAKTFPVLGEVTAWRLYEDWVIVLADATRHELIRFTSDEAGYSAAPETDGIVTIVQPQDKISPAE